MTKPTVTINSPSDELVERAKSEVVVTDPKGRNLLLKKPSVLAQYDIILALGDAAKNEVYTAMVLPLIYLSAIDEDPIPFPRNMNEIRALIQRLDEDGIMALGDGVTKHFGSPDPEADKQALKN